MSGKREHRQRAEALRVYKLDYKFWKSKEPPRWRFISHYFWKKKEPQRSEYTYDKCVKKLFSDT